MRKTFTLILALVVSLLTLQASAAMYIVGNDPFGGWKTNAGLEMTASGTTYTADATINGTVYLCSPRNCARVPTTGAPLPTTAWVPRPTTMS